MTGLYYVARAHDDIIVFSRREKTMMSSCALDVDIHMYRGWVETVRWTRVHDTFLWLSCREL